MKPNLMQILERMNKVYTKNVDRINESTDWVHYFYQPSNNLKTKQDLRNYFASYWKDNFHTNIIMKITIKKEHTVYIQKKKILVVQKKKIHF